MNAFTLFRICAQGKAKAIAATLTLEWIHTALAVAPNGVVVWLVWQLTTYNTVPHSVWWILAGFIGLFGVQLVLAPRVVSQVSNLSYHLSCNLRNRLAQHATTLGLGVYGSQRLGSFADQINHAIDQFEFVLSHSLTNLLAAISTPVVLIGLLLWLDWRLSLIMASCLLVVLVVFHWLGEWIVRHEQVKAATKEALRNEVQLQLSMLPFVKSHASAYYWSSRYRPLAERAGAQQQRLETQAKPLAQLPSFLLDIGFVLALWLGIALLEPGRIGWGNLLLFALIGYRVFEPVRVLMADWQLLRQLDSQLQPAVRFLQQRPMQVHLVRGGAKPAGYNVECDALCFAYPNQQQPLFTELNCIFAEGATTALVGVSGSGKTTLLQLLMRFWDPQSGVIRIGGVSLTSLQTQDIAALFAPVFQQPYLFNDTLINNVRFGKPDASAAELSRALEVSGCIRLAEDLPQGMDTVLGEGGKTLSGGQQQLVAIARCLLKDAPIVLFDEATAALDPENSRLVYQAADALGAGKTRIIVAHDLHRVSTADAIVVLDGGRVCQYGTHTQLLNSEGVYARLWENQRQAQGWHIKRCS